MPLQGLEPLYVTPDELATARRLYDEHARTAPGRDGVRRCAAGDIEPCETRRVHTAVAIAGYAIETDRPPTGTPADGLS